MPVWKPTYKIRRSSRILSFAVRQNQSALDLFGEPVFLLKRMSRANAPAVQRDNRRVSTITKVASAYTVDPDTGYLRYKLWGRSTEPIDEYPDMMVFTATVAASASTDVWEMAIDKYSFINGRIEYTFDIFQDQLDSNLDEVEDTVYIVFNTPPMVGTYVTTFTFGYINPLVKFEGMQPIRDTEEDFKRSLFGFDQWLNATSRIRSRVQPNRFLLCFPSIDKDFVLTDAGFLQDSRVRHWTNPPPYCPKIEEFDVIVRQATGQRYQVINYTDILIEDILVSQQFDLVELDPRSSVYDVAVRTT